MPTLREHMSAKKVLQELNAAARDAETADPTSLDALSGGAVHPEAESTEPGLRASGLHVPKTASSVSRPPQPAAASQGQQDGHADPTMLDAPQLDPAKSSALATQPHPVTTSTQSDGSGEQTAIRPAKEMPTGTIELESGDPSAQVEAPSRRSLGNDATQFVPVPEGGEPESSIAEELARQAARQKELQTVSQTQPLAQVRPQRPAGPDATLVQGAKPAGRPDSTLVMRDEPSLGVQHTQLMEIPAEETAVRPLFSQDRKKASAESPRPAEPATLPGGASRGRARLWAGLFLGLVIGGSGWATGTWLLERQRQGELAGQCREALNDAHRHGRIADFAAAESKLRSLLSKRPTDGAALAARALVLSEAQYELGGAERISGTLAATDGSKSAAQPATDSPAAIAADKRGADKAAEPSAETAGATSWAGEAQAAARQAEGEATAAAYSAQVLAALATSDLKAAERAWERLQALPPEADQHSELAPLPPGWRAYLASQVALLGGREEEALVSLSDAVGKSPLPLWRRRLAELLIARGRVDDALTQLSAAEKDQADLCGVQIDLASIKVRKAVAAPQRQALQALQEWSTPVRTGIDPCGKGDRARAALSVAELTLQTDPTARADARAALERARTVFGSDDAAASDRLAAAWLRTGDPRLAQKQSQETLSRVPNRRRTRLLLAESLLRLNQGADALRALEPLLSASAAGGEDGEAALLKARVLLSLNDTLEAQKLARKLVATTSQSPLVRAGAQRVLARVSLILGEPATARRTLEPLHRQLAALSSVDAIQREEQLDTQILWAEVLLSVRPAEQNEARAILEAVVTRAPERIEARLLLGRLLREMQEWGQAEQQLSAALRTDDRHMGARRELAGLLTQRGDYAKAHALYQELIKEEQDAELLIAAARAERLNGAAEPALNALAGVKRGRGEVTGKYDEALLVERARALLALDRCGEAQTLLKPLLPDLAQLKRPASGPPLPCRRGVCFSACRCHGAVMSMCAWLSARSSPPLATSWRRAWV
jgi:tetratricopeptide (TPR) repeat protein